MELKEMEGTGVIIETEEELNDFITICKEGGWDKQQLHTGFQRYKSAGFYIDTDSETCFGSVTNTGAHRKLITLAEFKKEQNIMRYSEGDVLESSHSEQTVEGVIGSVYVCVDDDGDAGVLTEKELNESNYSLKTETPITELTLEQVAEKMNIPVSQLRIKD